MSCQTKEAQFRLNTLDFWIDWMKPESADAHFYIRQRKGSRFLLEDLLSLWLYISDKLMENVAPVSRSLKQWDPSDMKTLAILLSLHSGCCSKLNPEIILINIKNWNLRKVILSKWKILERVPQIRIKVSTNIDDCISHSWRSSVYKTVIVNEG